MSGGVSLVTMAANLAFTGGAGQRYFSAALTVSIAMIVLAYLSSSRRSSRCASGGPELERPFRVPGGLGVAWLISVVATGWSLLAAVCLLWPGFGTADPDAALPAGFEGQRLQFELLVADAGRPRRRARLRFYRLGARRAAAS